MTLYYPAMPARAGIYSIPIPCCDQPTLDAYENLASIPSNGHKTAPDDIAEKKPPGFCPYSGPVGAVLRRIGRIQFLRGRGTGKGLDG